jgi:hypothetical protein
LDAQSRDNFLVTHASMPQTNTLDWPGAPRVNLAFQVRDFAAAGDLGYRGVRGTVGLGYSTTV